ncbi:MAG: RagB/SusD family nutrient uptake outer membrane protein [Chitinophagaceae bacterium]|nr:RagB/SusD family nutrient uptake outer membrane protein [Chitinophagaceae bacterium]
MKHILLYTFLPALLLLQFSCNKQLSEPPKNAKVEVTAITDQQTAQIALNGAYHRFANVDANNVTDWTTHQVWPGMLAGSIGYGLGALSDERNDNVNSSYAGIVWNQNYLILNAANGVINGTDAVADNGFTGNRKKEIIAEGRFIRAYAHFKLLSHFAEWYKLNSPHGVLLRDKLSTLSNISKPRSSVAESYQFLLDDLDYSIANGPAANPNHYATKWAAMALKMRVLLMRGQTADFGEVINLGNTILTSGPYVLENNLKDIFYVKGLASKEVILGVAAAKSGKFLLYP